MSRMVSDLAENPARCRAGERYGIEVEVEGWAGGTPPDGVLDYWRTTTDGSLRNNGVEFVSKPLARSAVPRAIGKLWPLFSEGLMRPSARTGIHIHMSCLGLSLEQVRRLVMHYALVEPIMFAHVGEQREESIYCIPWYRSLPEVRTVREFLTSVRGQPCKYSALFVGPLVHYGTIEFRHAPTWPDTGPMLLWYDMVQALYQTALTDYDVLGEYRRLGPDGFARSVFGDLAIPAVPAATFDECDVELVADMLRRDPHAPVSAPGVWGKPPALEVARPFPVLRGGPPDPPAVPEEYREDPVEFGSYEEDLYGDIETELSTVNRLTGEALTVNATAAPPRDASVFRVMDDILQPLPQEVFTAQTLRAAQEALNRQIHRNEMRHLREMYAAAVPNVLNARDNT